MLKYHYNPNCTHQTCTTFTKYKRQHTQFYWHATTPHHFTTPFFLCLATILRHHLICAKPQPFETPFTCVWPTFYDTILSVSWPPSLIPFFLYLATILRHHLICAKPQPFETPFTCVRPTFYDTILSVSWPPSFLRHPFNCVKRSFPFDTL